jgi:hypothetical protein
MALRKRFLFFVLVSSVWCLLAQGTGADDGQTTWADQGELEKDLNQVIQSALGDRATCLEDNGPLLYHCRKASGDFLSGKSNVDPSGSWIWGGGELHTIPFEKPEDAVPKLVDKLKPTVSVWMLGVAYCRNAVYPDGMYAVTLVTFPRKPSSDQADRLVLSLLNTRRKQRGLSDLTWSTLLVNQAKSQLRNFKATRKIKIPYKGLKLYYAYETPDLETIPLELLDRLEHDSIREIGICVIKEKSKRFLAGAFLISLVGN